MTPKSTGDCIDLKLNSQEQNTQFGNLNHSKIVNNPLHPTQIA